MSRTYRRTSPWLDQSLKYGPRLRKLNWTDRGLFWSAIDPKSPEGLKIMRGYHSDRGQGWMNWNGPSWFHRAFSQRPYRAQAEQELHKWFRDPEHEVQILSKPKREYWL